ncbi:DUF1501 domain-containing protein [Oceanithermus sp.]|uniref:DUF1501 domain-containing protein n=1 Tax=Oceanithermus sp. TaxID=2268145 RepID=UPI00257BF7AF|nr:DUF1501 domain-containing protein [Oceanithermus sp.]
MNRRSLLKTLGVLGVSHTLFPGLHAQLAFAEGDRERRDALVVVFQRGGADGLGLVAPYAEGGRYYDRRPTTAVPEPGRKNGGLDLDDRFALHPELAPLFDLYREGRLAVVHAAGSPDETRSHFDAQQYMEFGTPGVKSARSGWLGRHLALTARRSGSPFRAVGLGDVVADSLLGPVTPLALRSIAEFHLQGRDGEWPRMQAVLRRLYAGSGPLEPVARSVWSSLETLADLARSPGDEKAYPDDVLGRGLAQVARLIKAGVGLEVATVDSDGWDTHEEQGVQNGRFAANAAAFARALAAFWADLGDNARGVTVVVMSEFGRRVEENASAGTDHGHGGVMWLLGAGVRGGRVYGRWPGLAREQLADGDLAVTTDFRDVLGELVTRRLGNPEVAQVFPGYRPRPLGIFEEVQG